MKICRTLRRELVLAAMIAAVAMGGISEEAVVPSYEVVELERKLFRETPEPELQLDVGARPQAGDLLRTGSRSSAEILCAEAGARFHLGSKTRARLASEAPGVLLELERGRLRALFDGFVGGEAPDRLVTTPSAVLAVRGTEYGVDVDGKGNTRVVVFSGEVDVVDVGGLGDPVRVGAGQYCDIRRGKPARPPAQHQVGPKDWDHGGGVGSAARTGDSEPGMGRGDGFGGDPRGMGGGGASGSGGAGSGGAGSGGSGSGGGSRGGGSGGGGSRGGGGGG
jgi:hypothetical protein